MKGPTMEPNPIPISGIPVESFDQFVKLKLAEPGTTWTGRYDGLREGLYGPAVVLATDRGVLLIPGKTALLRQIRRVRVGAEHVTVRFDGMRHNDKSRRDFYALAVFVGDVKDLLPAEPQHRRDAAPLTTDGVAAGTTEGRDDDGIPF
jgi:hypothetical protein